ncbi:unnamed protein product [Acanthoscelides obtectus]|uniref:Uncharacterized protein n=1 Tax=Acanthoscelides obtectus TaxID=200917 RepID=A0A9P0VSQ8_ACAOB|nr:unnamed protein product [Acanthoscelides obtectus]CAK1688195.1 hypothetical protein AOBTE_LOCUS36598 [Acanthoscelides obtectus]
MILGVDWHLAEQAIVDYMHHVVYVGVEKRHALSWLYQARHSREIEEIQQRAYHDALSSSPRPLCLAASEQSAENAESFRLSDTASRAAHSWPDRRRERIGPRDVK